MRVRTPPILRLRSVAVAVALGLVAASCAEGKEVAFSTSAATAEGLSQVAAGPVQEGGLLPVAPSQSTGGANPGAPSTAPGDATGSEPGSPTATPNAPSGDTPQAATPANADPIKLGTILPLQGGERDFGEPILRTTQAFIDELNARGGLNGRPLEIVAYHACLLCQGEALTAARRLVEQDKVFAFVNTYPMVVPFQSVLPYLIEQGVPLVQGGSFDQTSDALSPVNFATAPSGLFYARWLVQTLKQFAKGTAVGIVYLDVPTETNGLPLLRRELAEAGIEIAGEEKIAAAEDAVTNMDSAVTRLRLAGADSLIALDPAVLIFGRLAARRQGFDAPWVGPAAWSRLVEEGCGATCDTVVFTDTGGLSFIDRDSPQMRQFLEVMERRVPGGELTGHTLAAWVGMQLLTHVLAKTGPDRDAFLAEFEQIRNLDLGTTSPLTFTPDKHLGGSETTIITLEGGKFVKFQGPVNFGEAKP